MGRLNSISTAILALIITANLYACGTEDNINNIEANNITTTESSDMSSAEESIITDIESSDMSNEEGQTTKLKVGDTAVKGPGEHKIYRWNYKITNIDHADIEEPNGYECFDLVPYVCGGDTTVIIVCYSNKVPVIVTATEVSECYPSEVCYADPGIPISIEDYQSIKDRLFTPDEMKKIYTIGPTETGFTIQKK